MIEDSIQDFRHVIEEKIKAKKHALDNTEQSLKKYAVLRDNANSAGVISSQPPRGPRGSIRGRLGPQVTQKPSIESRLGPKVQENEAVEDDTYEPTILSRVVVEQQKSRDEALAEETQKMNKKDKQRNRRIFSNLLGTLQKFKQDETRMKPKEQKKREVEKKIEEKTEREKEEAKRNKNELFSEKRKQQQEIRMLQIQMDRVQEFELWEKNKKREMQYIRTSVADQPQIFYMPKEHNEVTKSKFEATVASIEDEIRTAKAAFEEDLIKIETRLNNPDAGGDDFFDDDEDEDEYEDENEAKPRSVIVKQPALKRQRDNSGEAAKARKDHGSIKVTIKNTLEPSAPKRIKEEPRDAPSRKRKKSSSSTSDESSESSRSGNEEEKVVKIKSEK